MSSAVGSPGERLRKAARAWPALQLKNSAVDPFEFRGYSSPDHLCGASKAHDGQSYFYWLPWAQQHLFFSAFLCSGQKDLIVLETRATLIRMVAMAIPRCCFAPLPCLGEKPLLSKPGAASQRIITSRNGHGKLGLRNQSACGLRGARGLPDFLLDLRYPLRDFRPEEGQR